MNLALRILDPYIIIYVYVYMHTAYATIFSSFFKPNDYELYIAPG